jgi:hypothetical protein
MLTSGEPLAGKVHTYPFVAGIAAFVGRISPMRRMCAPV